jgi:MoaA/NifB/PqqE/SkfB family radical SAM enzyme
VARRYHAVAQGSSRRPALRETSQAGPDREGSGDRARQVEEPVRGRAGNGPRLVEIELSAACNLRCIGCWCHSELLDGDRHERLQTARPLPTERLLELLSELAVLGVREVQFSGSGEPLMNRDAVAIIEHAAGLGLATTLVTNGVLLDEDVAARLTVAGLRRMTASVWAGDAETYLRTHPGVAADAFERLTRGLKSVTAARDSGGVPHLKLYHVISRLNYDSIGAMIDHALAVDADSIELQLIDLVDETEDALALRAEQVATIEEGLSSLRKRPDFTRLWLGVLPVRDDAPAIVRDEVTDFGRFLRLGERAAIFTPIDGRQLRCRRGVTVDGHEGRRQNVVEFPFPDEVCDRCDLRSSCFGAGRAAVVYAPTMSLTGVGSFVRRARAAATDSACGEAEIIRDLPCVVGDVYSRIDYRGNVVACCKGSAAPLGNVSDTPFLTVWRSPPYAEFRRNALALAKDDPYFEPFGCLRSCDNLGMNLRAQFIEPARSEGEGS